MGIQHQARPAAGAPGELVGRGQDVLAHRGLVSVDGVEIVGDGDGCKQRAHGRDGVPGDNERLLAQQAIGQCQQVAPACAHHGRCVHGVAESVHVLHLGRPIRGAGVEGVGEDLG